MTDNVRGRGECVDLLTSLANVCRNDAGMLVTPLEDGTAGQEPGAEDPPGRDKASEFTCWLLAELSRCTAPRWCARPNGTLQAHTCASSTPSTLVFCGDEGPNFEGWA
ncbi:hypothetical protein GWK47_044210 [Chionoecetes opilio]|uniref:Uncharacterized protein n=1 Tax=Chionoecetes opilio TaxID=41210 RepID=A0A8J4Y7H8_CHIOP|nr:hypothetical protein GWK47_044210 [Chionoecetes opilio]